MSIKDPRDYCPDFEGAQEPDKASTEGLSALACYLQKIARIPLLNAQAEVALAQQIEHWMQVLLRIFAQYPSILEPLMEGFKAVEAGQQGLSELLHGFMDKAWSVDPDGAAQALEERVCDVNHPERVKARFEQLKALKIRAEASLNRLGRQHPQTQHLLEVLSQYLIPFKLNRVLIKHLKKTLCILFKASASKNPEVQNTHRRLLKAEAAWRQAQHQLTQANLRLVLSIARRYQNQGLSLFDLIQEGSLGLMQAVDRFDYRLGYKFSTYATLWIRQALARALDQKARLIHVPVYVSQLCYKLKKAHFRILQETGLKPTAEALAQRLHVPLVQVHQALRVQEPLSLQMPLRPDDERLLEESIADTQTLLPDEALVQHDLKQVVHQLLAQLPPREAEILKMRFGLEGLAEHSLQAIGTEWGLSQERVRQIIVKALKKLKNPLSRQSLQGFLEAAHTQEDQGGAAC